MLKAASKEHALKSIEKKKKGGKGGKGGKSSASSERDKALRLTRARSFVENVEVAAVMDSGECKSVPLHSDCCALGMLLCLLNFVPLPPPSTPPPPTPVLGGRLLVLQVSCRATLCSS